MQPTEMWEAAMPPLSFRYGGRPAAELLPHWERDDTVEQTPEGSLRRCRFRDPAGGLEVIASVRIFSDFPAADWVLEFANRSTADTPIIADILPLDMSLPVADDERVILHHAKGSMAKMDDFLPLANELISGECFRLAATSGRSADGVFPFMNLQGKDGGTVAAIGWTGGWQASFDRDKNALRMAAGMSATHLCLHPGESIRTPRILLIDWRGDDPATGNNLLRRLLLTHYVPRINGEIVLPPVACNSQARYYFTGDVSEAGELAVMARAGEIGAEAYWIDACWYGSGKQWSEEVGNWQVNPERFPHGLAPIAEAAHERAMKFVLWFEPERVRPTTRIATEHPEFLLRSPESEDRYLLNLGLPEARAYVTELVSRMITQVGIDIYRQDFNMNPASYWQAADSPDRVGMSEIRHIEGLYAFWDDLRRRHPQLVIDNCSSGGRRIDLETTSRSFPLWRSDFSDVGGPAHGPGLQIGDQCQTAGLSRWVPLHTAAVWTYTPYAFRSAMSSGVVPYGDILREDFPVAEARRAIEQLKRLRPYFLGDFYPLLPLTLAAHDWCAYQFHCPDLEAGFAVFLRRHDSSFPVMQAVLRGINEDATYEAGVTFSFDEPEMRTVAGGELARFEVRVPDRPGSALLEYRQL